MYAQSKWNEKDNLQTEYLLLQDGHYESYEGSSGLTTAVLNYRVWLLVSWTYYFYMGFY